MALTDAFQSSGSNPPEATVEEQLVLLPKPRKLSSDLKTLGNLLISIVGAGVLGLPYSFMKAGWLFGLLSLAGVAAITYYGMILLVKSRKKVEEKLGDGTTVNTYGELGFHVYGTPGQLAADSMIILSQCGFCVAYFIFIGQNLSSIVAGSIQRKALFIGMIAPMQMGLSWLKSLTKLAPFSIVADAVNLVAYSVVLTRDFQAFQGFQEAKAFGGLESVPFTLGVAVYAFEGAGMILSLETSMKKRSHFGGVLALGLSLIVLIYSIFGAAGYLGFGEDTMDIITLNLPPHWTTDAVKLGICFSLFFTFPVMMTPVYETYERRLSSSQWFQDHVESSQLLRRGLQRTLRSALVLAIVYIAVAVPQFSLFISLIGSSVCSLLGFVLPAVFHWHVIGSEATWFERVADLFLIVFGFGFGIWGTYNSLYNIFVTAA